MFNKKTFAIALLTLLSVQSFAQTITSSPYSRFGLGELQQTNTVVSIAMGGINNGSFVRRASQGAAAAPRSQSPR